MDALNGIGGTVVWTFYHDVVSTSSEMPSEAVFFFVFTLLIGMIILAPSFFEKRNK
tara:strand:- start:223 stop:390 length:168 start_codon:yes stop_codon:yes gene_type:complete